MIEWYEILLRLICAVLLGGAIGFERERKDWAAGIRTHMMASMGAALVMMVSCFGFEDILGYPNVELDPSRVASSVVIGIGYLGAGIILVLKRGNIRGVTTASALWSAAAVGLAVGGGMYFTALATTVLALLVLYTVQRIQQRIALRPAAQAIRLNIRTSNDNVPLVIGYLESCQYEIGSVRFKGKREKCWVKLRLVASREKLLAALPGLQALPDVDRVIYSPLPK